MKDKEMKNSTDKIQKLLQKLSLHLSRCEDMSSTSERQELWTRIKKDTSRRQFRTKSMRLFTTVSSIAAIVVIILFSPLKNHLLNSESDLSQIALDFEVDMDSITEIQLMISANDIVLVDDGSLVSHSNTGVIGVNKGIVESKDKAVEDEYHKLIVPRGKRASLLLSDGTKLDVNAGTKVVYPRTFKNNRREIFVDGEIFIDVMPNKNIPFIVKTSRFDVRVLGTSFNIKSYSDEQNRIAEIVLVKGKVRVEDIDGEELLMSPNQLVTLTDRGMEKFTNIDVSMYTSWRDGIINIDGLSLDKVFNQLIRFYGVKIQWDPQVGEHIIGGKLDLDDSIDEVFRRLSLIVSFTYEYKADTGIYYIEMIDEPLKIISL